METDSQHSGDSETKIPKAAKKKAKKEKHDYNAWKHVLKTEQQKNANRIEEVERKYKVSLINELMKKEKTYE